MAPQDGFPDIRIRERNGAIKLYIACQCVVYTRITPLQSTH